jgi:two-component system chemotaxis sensor kinase CheA
MEPMLEMFIFETNQNLEQLEQITMNSEKNGTFSNDEINDIFRIMHTIKGSSAMMLVNEVATLAHSIEDIFFYMRENKPENVECSTLTDIILESADFIKEEISKLEVGKPADASASSLIESTKAFLTELKTSNGDIVQEKISKKPTENQQYYIASEKVLDEAKELNVFYAVVKYKENCEMENIRAYTVMNSMQDVVKEIYCLPDNILEDDDSVFEIRKNGFKIWFTTTKSYEEIHNLLEKTIFLQNLTVSQLANIDECEYWPAKKAIVKEVVLDEMPIKPILTTNKTEGHDAHQTMISVNVAKLDVLMDLVGELVIAEAMVTQNPELAGLELKNFHKASRQLKKISSELQDGVMSIRMVPLSGTFQKMNRIVRDMSKKLNKQVELVLVGEETEVDKNVIEHISDPLMHLIRNSLDHGIEIPEVRVKNGKNPIGKITLEAKNAGNEVVINIVDDGQGLNRDKILERARENNLIYKNEAELTDKEIYSFIFAPGFSTKEKVTEFSGRGVGMDVVMKNINAVGGTILVNSEPGKGSMITLKIPLTLAIITGMTVKVGNASYTIPIVSIRESFRPAEQNIIHDPDGSEMIMVRGQCYPIVRLHKIYNISTKVTDFTKGIIIMVETEKMTIGIFADQLVGQQQIVVKPVPVYIKNISNIAGITGCTLLGDGSISLILDAVGLMSKI